MRICSFFAALLVSSSLIAAEFQLPDFVLGTAQTTLKADPATKTSLTLFETKASVDPQWTEDKLTAVALNFYQGTDYTEFRQKFAELQQGLHIKVGSLAWVSPEATTDTTQSPEQQLALLDQVMKTAPDTADSYKQSHLANANLVLDFQPKPQPDNCRLHLQLSFSSISGEYSVILFVDEKSAAERTAAAVVNLEAL